MVLIGGQVLIDGYVNPKYSPVDRYFLIAGGSWGSAVGGSVLLNTAGTGLCTLGYVSSGQMLLSSAVMLGKASPVIPALATAGYGCYQISKQSPANGYCPQDGYADFGNNPQECIDNYFDYAEQIYGISPNTKYGQGSWLEDILSKFSSTIPSQIPVWNGGNFPSKPGIYKNESGVPIYFQPSPIGGVSQRCF